MRFAIAATLLALACALAAQSFAMPNDACEAIAGAFQQGDFALLTPVLFDLSDDAAFDSLFRRQEGVDEIDITQYTVARSDVEEDFAQNLLSLQQCFESALAVADSMGIDRPNMRYGGYTVHGEELWLGYRIFYNFEIVVTQGEQTFWLNPGVLRETPTGWKLAAGQGCRFIWR